MKFIAVTVAALASLAAAAPHPPAKCKPATYQCDHHNGAPSWDVCNTSGVWVFAGNCPPNTICKFDTANGSPYCVPPNFQFP